MTVFATLAERARTVKRELLALALAVRHPSTPWYAVVGFIDDLIFLPLAIGAAWLGAVALITVWTVR